MRGKPVCWWWIQIGNLKVSATMLWLDSSTRDYSASGSRLARKIFPTEKFVYSRLSLWYNGFCDWCTHKKDGKGNIISNKKHLSSCLWLLVTSSGYSAKKKHNNSPSKQNNYIVRKWILFKTPLKHFDLKTTHCKNTFCANVVDWRTMNIFNN